MNPGQELDVVIAENIMGYKVARNKRGDWSLGPADYYDSYGELILANPLPEYSKDITAAMSVVEELKNLQPYILSWTGVTPGPFSMDWDVNKWRVGWKIDVAYEGDMYQVCAISDTLPHAICLAALKAIVD